ncbi:MAG: hypothetical protein O7A04_04010 [Acidobacteria bacterium]|nr:hypothetical protein [Acidobacteriota bacterium]
MRARDNPFRADRLHGLRYRAPGFRWPELLARLDRQGGLGAIRGPEGSGKTTLLRELGERLGESGFDVRLLRPSLSDPQVARQQVRDFTRRIDRHTALLLDGADRVGPIGWRLLRQGARRAGVLVVSTHREGRLPTLHRCATSAALLAELVGELLPVSARGVPGVGRLFERERGDVRRALRSLYDRFAER